MTSQPATTSRNRRPATKQQKRKPYRRMTTDELPTATAAFDREELSAPRPVRAVKRRRYLRARRGRPRQQGDHDYARA